MNINALPGYIYSGSIIKSSTVSQNTNLFTPVPIPAAKRNRLKVYGVVGSSSTTLNI